MSTAPEPREVGWRFDAVDLRVVARWLNDSPVSGLDHPRVTAGPKATTVAQYFDTNDRRFDRAGYTLRILRSGRRRDAVLARLDSVAPTQRSTDAGHGLREALARDTVSPIHAEGPVGERVRAVVGRKRLFSLFEVRTRRSLFAAELGGAPLAEIALEETTIKPADGSPPARLRRVEIEPPAQVVLALEPFVRALATAAALRPTTLTEYQVGLLTAGLERSHSERFGSTDIGRGMPIGAVALAVLRKQFTELLAREPGTRLGDDVEELHDMRVASRRLRAALALFSNVLPQDASDVVTELRWVGDFLGAVRDLDVQIEQLDARLAADPHAPRQELAPLRALLDSHRTTTRTAMLDALDSRRYELFVNRFGRILRARRVPEGDARTNALAACPPLLEERIRRLRRSANAITPTSEPSDYHRVRLHCKRLRYALEFSADVYPTTARPALKRLVALQDDLGEHQDADVAIGHLRSLAVHHTDELPPATVFTMGELAERYRTEAAAVRARFPKSRTRLKGKPWKALGRDLERGRKSALAVDNDSTGERTPPAADPRPA
jgi:CHAD domain-containing protein